jgi:hypothetical protein
MAGRSQETQGEVGNVGFCGVGVLRTDRHIATPDDVPTGTIRADGV